MKKFKKVYYFDVFDKIKAGEEVYMVDRLQKDVPLINEFALCDWARILQQINEDSERFDFFTEKEVIVDDTV